ncbi:MAG: rhomboid family intramembrane serine protease [Acidobacteriota bacterium]
MFERVKSGSVVCRSCGRLVGVNDERCYNCGAWNPGLWGYARLFQRLGRDLGFVHIVTWGCMVVYLLTLLWDLRGITLGGFAILGPSNLALYTFGASGSFPVLAQGRWWTLLSAAWLHGGLLHIGFNMMWVRQLSPVTADVYGPSRLVIIYTVSTITGFLLSTLAGTPLTLGASAPLFGLFGALVWAGYRTGSGDLVRQALTYAVVLFLFGFLWRGIDNFAHFGGFAGGFLAGMAFNPFRRETFGELVAALICILLTALSLIASVALA